MSEPREKTRNGGSPPGGCGTPPGGGGGENPGSATTLEAAVSQSTPARKPRGRRLSSLRNVRTALADIYRDLEGWNPKDLRPAERISRARTLVYASQSLGELIRSSEIEERIEELEKDITKTREELERTGNPQ